MKAFEFLEAEVAKDPLDRRVMHKACLARSMVAHMLFQMEDVESSIVLMERNVADLESSVERDPNDLRAYSDLLRDVAYLMRAYRAQEDWSAMIELGEAYATLPPVAASVPTILVATLQSNLLTELGIGQFRMGLELEAGASFAQAEKVLEDYLETPGVTNQLGFTQIRSYVMQARVQRAGNAGSRDVERRRLEAACRYLERAVEISVELGDEVSVPRILLDEKMSREVLQQELDSLRTELAELTDQ